MCPFCFIMTQALIYGVHVSVVAAQDETYLLDRSFSSHIHVPNFPLKYRAVEV